jgi:hypothetical protein
MGSGTRLEELTIAEDGTITFNFTDLTHQQLVENSFILEKVSSFVSRGKQQTALESA